MLQKLNVNREEVYEKLKELFELKPYYVYEFKQNNMSYVEN